LVEGFSKTFDAIIEKGVLTRFEERKIQELVKGKYGLTDYTMRKGRP
jgi:hypothetical protein